MLGIWIVSPLQYIYLALYFLYQYVIQYVLVY